jgi:tight adherence protein B
MLVLLAVMIFASLAAAGYAAAGWMHGRQEAQRALQSRLETAIGGPVAGASPSLMKDRSLSHIAILDALLARLSLVAPLVRMIEQAGLRKRVGEVLLYVPLLGCFGFLVATLLTGNRLLGVASALLGGALPLLAVQRMRRRRAALFAEQLPDALDLIRAALQAGHGLVSALGVVADEFPDPIAQEFRYVAEEVRLGLTMRDALTNLARRVNDPNLPILVVGVLVALNVGGNLAEVMDNISYTIRERFKLFREMRVLTAQGRLSGSVLTVLPLLVALAMCLLSPTYFAPMLESRAGNLMLAYAAVSLLCGHVVIRRLVTFRV